MTTKNKIRNSWINPELPNECLKKEQLEFSKRKRITISIRTYAFSIASLLLIFSLTFFFVKYDYKNSNNEKPKIEFGSLDPFELNVATKELSKININNKSYYNVRGNFSIWFNSLNAHKAKIDYSNIDLNYYIQDVNPVNICVSNEEYLLFFTKKDYLIILFNDIYIMYNLENADILLESFVSSF